MPKISVIMPCLNMAQYIESSLTSVRNQTLRDIEMLVIDAGSTDGTVDILEACAERDSRIRIIHSDRRSYGYQVNLGIAAAAGEYISVVDTDDLIKPDMFETLYPVAVESGADYVKGTADLFYAFGGIDYRIHAAQFPEEAYSEKGRIEVCPYEMPQLLCRDNFMWGGIYQKDFFQQFRLHESPGAAFQDLGGILQTQMNAEKAVYLAKTVYEYRQDNMASSNSNPKGIHFVADEYGWAEQFVEDAPPAWRASFYRKLFLHTQNRLEAMAEAGRFCWEMEEDLEQICRRLRRALDECVICEEDFEAWEWEELQILLECPWTLYDRLFQRGIEEGAPANRLIMKLRKRKTVIFGCGQLGTFFRVLLLSRGKTNAIAFCDSRSAEMAPELCGLPVLSPEEAVAQYPDAQYVVANKYHNVEMEAQLLALGIPENAIHLYKERVSFRVLHASQIKISVIVTIHNAEKYLRECLDSVLGQTFRDIEILCMDGGSTDATPQILSEYADRDGRIRIINDPNTSYGHKVNEGVRQARGAYISVLESDDMYMPDMLERLYGVAQQYIPDYVNADYENSWDVDNMRCRELVKMYPPQDYNRVLESGRHPEDMRQILRYWTGLFRRDFLLRKDIRMNESPGAAFQDISFRFLTSALADTCYHLDAPVYLYRIDNPNSSVNDPGKAVVTADEFDFLQSELERRKIENFHIWRHFYTWKYNDICGNISRHTGEARKALYERCFRELKRDRAQLEKYHVREVSRSLAMLLDTPEADIWAEMENRHRKIQEQNQMRERFYRGISKRGAVIFGCGTRGKRTLTDGSPTVRECILCFTDNDEKLWNTTVGGYPVLPPEEAVRRYPDAQYIVANRFHAGEIREQLRRFGIPEEQIWGD